ncbi:Phosphatidylinositol (PI) 3-kinase [Elasticomyces elasticus]|nr:Phosphatidylinositol (PI) 3-kinase [Elasticomyces elasticus]
MEPFTFAASTDLKLPAAVKISRLEGTSPPLPYSTLLSHPSLRHRGSNLSPHSDLYITLQPYSDSKPLTVHTQTPYKHFKTAPRVWNQWLTLPVSYNVLPVNTVLAVTIWDLSPINSEGGDEGHHVPFGGTTIPLYDDEGTLRTGRQKCKVWIGRHGDGYSDTGTPWQVKSRNRRSRRGREDEEETVVISAKQSRKEAELERLVGLMKRHEMGEIAENKWLDQMVFRQIEKMERQSVREGSRPKTSAPTSVAKTDDNDGAQTGETKTDGYADEDEGEYYLYLEFPRFDHPIVFTDHEYPAPPISSLLPTTQQNPSTAPNNTNNINLKPPPELHPGPGLHSTDQYGGGSDAEGGTWPLLPIYDPEVGYGDNPAETKHRRLIRGQRNALDRDLKPNPKMRDYLNRVMEYGPTVELGEKERDEVWRFRHHLARDKRALTKLVKSVNWNEPAESRQAIALLPKWVEIDVDDALELLGPGVANPAVRAYAVDRLRKADDEQLLLYLLQLVQALKFEPKHDKDDSSEDGDSSLAGFLVERAAANLKLGNFLHWYLMVELDDDNPSQSEHNRQIFARVSYDFMRQLETTSDGKARRKVLLRQGEMITVLTKISKDIRSGRGDRLKKIADLKKALADPKNEMIWFEPALPLPLDPGVRVVSVVAEEGNVFKSTLLPLYVKFRVQGGGEYGMIFKTGDDLRQDQLVVQILALMDRLLRKENLDLKLTPYRILATATLAGCVQFIPSTPISGILGAAKYKGSILGYLRFHNPPGPGESSVLGVRKEVMETYVKSVAGYCVITYLLGVGDRHLDNLMLAPDGHFFHIDFGYILGRDPKPMAPLMKLSREMVEGMGGTDLGLVPESQFEVFRQYCFTAYTTLRRSSSLILNLFGMMVDAGIPGLVVLGGDAVEKVEERFKLGVGEVEAVGMFGALIEREMGAWGPVLIDKLHGLTQGWRA